MRLTDATWEELTGGWPSLLQGGVGSVVGTLIGTLIGVLGAFWVACWTTHRELNRDRNNFRDQARIGAADRLGPNLHGAVTHLRYLNGDRIYADQSWAAKRVSAWMQLSDSLRRQAAADGAILPEEVQQMLKDVTGRLEDAYHITEHGHAAPPFFEPGDDQKVAALQSDVEETITALNTMRSDIYRPRTRTSRYRRVGVVWTIAGVALLLAIVLAALLLLG